MELNNAILERRTIRFYELKKVEKEKVLVLLEAARMAPSASNMQRLRYVVVQGNDTAEKLFRETGWAGAVKPKRNPEWGRNAASTFIVLIAPPGGNQNIVNADAGAAIQNMMLKAVELGLGCCWIGSFNKENVVKLLNLDENEYFPVFVLAVGYPAEKPVSEDIDDPAKIKYYLDENDRIHVPKLTVKSLIKDCM